MKIKRPPKWGLFLICKVDIAKCVNNCYSEFKKEICGGVFCLKLY